MMDYRKGILEKIETLNKDKEPYLRDGSIRQDLVLFEPRIGSRCMVGTLCTSTITDILKNENNEIIFKTLNSIYKLTYEIN